MEPLRLDTLAAQVVAWHNRHPLACRISAAQVQGMGYVVVPAMQLQAPVPLFASPPLQSPASLQDSGPGAAPAPAEPSAAEASTAVLADVQLAGAEPAGAGPAVEAETQTEKIRASEALAEVAVDVEAEVAAEIAAEVASEAAAEAAAEVAVGPVAHAAPEDAGAVADETEMAEAPTAQPVQSPADAAPPAPSLRERLTARPAGAVAPAVVKPAAPATAAANGAPAERGPTAAAAATATATSSPAAHDPQQPFRLAFSERFVDHTPAQRLARWVLLHGRLLAVKLPAQAPVWHVARDTALSVPRAGSAERPVGLLLRSATLLVGKRPLRLLVGPGFDPAVLGPRLWSAPRVALACLPLLLLPVTAATAWWLGAHTARQQVQLAQPGAGGAVKHVLASPTTMPTPSPAASTPGGAAQTPQPADHAAGAVAQLAVAELAVAELAVASTAAATSSAAAASAAFAAYAAHAASAAQATHHATLAALAQPPVEAEPRQGTVELPPLGPLFSDPRFEPTRQRRLAARAARAVPPEPQAATATAQAAAAAPASPRPQTQPTTQPKSQPRPAITTPPPPAQTAPTAAFALATRALRTEAEAEQVQVAMRTLLTLTDDPATGPKRVQRIPVGDDWRVMGGPFGSRAAAERARALLLARGVKTEVVDIPPAAAVASAALT